MVGKGSPLIYKPDPLSPLLINCQCFRVMHKERFLEKNEIIHRSKQYKFYLFHSSGLLLTFVLFVIK